MVLHAFKVLNHVHISEVMQIHVLCLNQIKEHAKKVWVDFVLKENVMKHHLPTQKMHNVIHGHLDVLLMEEVVNHQFLVQIFRTKLLVEQLLDVNGHLHAKLQLHHAVHWQQVVKVFVLTILKRNVLGIMELVEIQLVLI